MNNTSIVMHAREYGLGVKVMKSEARKVDLPTFAALRKVTPKMDGESRNAYDKRIESIRDGFKANLDIMSDAISSASTRQGYYTKSIVEKPNGERIITLAPPEVDSTLQKKLAAIAKLQAEVEAIQQKSEVIEVVA
jgi:hypothetical protein